MEKKQASLFSDFFWTIWHADQSMGILLFLYGRQPLKWNATFKSKNPQELDQPLICWLDTPESIFGNDAFNSLTAVVFSIFLIEAAQWTRPAWLGKQASKDERRMDWRFPRGNTVHSQCIALSRRGLIGLNRSSCLWPVGNGCVCVCVCVCVCIVNLWPS